MQRVASRVPSLLRAIHTSGARRAAQHNPLLAQHHPHPVPGVKLSSSSKLGTVPYEVFPLLTVVSLATGAGIYFSGKHLNRDFELRLSHETHSHRHDTQIPVGN